MITTTGWQEHAFRDDHLDLHVLLPHGELLLADEKKQLTNPCVSEVYTLPGPTEGVITVATNTAVQRELAVPKL